MARLDAVEERLRRHATTSPPSGLTAPDPPTGDRWDWGQVWAHLAEFVPYWMDQIGLALAAGPAEQPPFGRVKSDPERLAAIERDRHRPAAELMARLEGEVQVLRALILGLPAADWERAVSHPTLGVMGMPRVFDEFLVGHLEQHADQLDELEGLRGEEAL